VVYTEYWKEVEAVAPEPETEPPRKVTVHSVLVASCAQSPDVGAGVVVAGEAVVAARVVVGAAVVVGVVVGAEVLEAG